MSVKISRILHAGYVVEYEGACIAFDPIFENPFSGNAHAFPNVQFNRDEIRGLHLDAVFISHFHDDHCSFESLNLLKRTIPIYMYCLHEQMFTWLRELGFTQVHALKLGETKWIGKLQVTPLRALDANVDSLFHIQAAGLNILNVVDSWIDDEIMQQLVRHAPWDLVLWPFQTMREIEVLSPSRFEPATRLLPPEWIGQLKMLKPRFVVPSSCQFQMEDWSWYNQSFFPISYRDFAQGISEALPEVQIVRMNPSTSFQLSNGGMTGDEALSWVVPVGPQDVDYKYDPKIVPMNTSAIAQRLPALNSQQRAAVDDYCKVQLLERYRGIGAAPSLFFNKRRYWRLCLCDSFGPTQEFYYELDGDQIRKLESMPPTLSWQTELPTAKLFAALTEGEALTSMYIRINDMQFAPEIEKEMQEVDILEDPLVRCLFEGVFGAYQKAQLQNIKQRL